MCVLDPAAHLQVSANGTYYCDFFNSVLHRGATLTVNVTADGDVFENVLAFENPGDTAPPASERPRGARPGAHGR